jgi:DNA invertase Pin-like site-specific DNA recombinase
MSEMTCVAYMRCSGDAQTYGDTWDRQIDKIKSYCVPKGMTLIAEYRDEAVPGKLGEESRPGFQQMVADLLGNGCRTVIVAGMDRFARQYDIQQQLITYLACKEITLISADTGEDITAALMGDPMRRAMVQIQGVLSELDKNMIVAKLKAARDRIRKEGRRIGAKNYSPDPIRNCRAEGRKPYGEHPDYPEEKAVVDRMIVLRAAGNRPDQIAQILNSEGVPTRGTKNGRNPWHSSTIAKILKRHPGKESSPYSCAL